MKGRRLFRKNIPQSVSVDSQLSEQANNNSIDKPNLLQLKPIGESPLTAASTSSTSIIDGGHHQHFMPQLHSSLCQLSPISSSRCSSTQGMIGCANELFESPTTTAVPRWDVPAQMRLLGERRRKHSTSGTHFGAECQASCSTLVKCGDKMAIPPDAMAGSGRSGGNNQVADLVFTLAQQLAGKDAEIGRLRAQQKKADGRMERVCREFERDLERQGQELDSTREQLGRMRKKLRAYETEAEIVQRVSQRMVASREEGLALAGVEGERERLSAENSQLKAKLAQQVQLLAYREADWERERRELKQSVQSLTGTMEELESELRQREAREREMQLELERSFVERDMARMRLAREETGTQRNTLPPLLDLPSPKTDSSSVDELPPPSTNSSSGIGSIQKEFAPEDLDQALAKAKRRLAECRAKVGQLVCTAEKALRGDRLSREDLFGTSWLSSDSWQKLKQQEKEQNQSSLCPSSIAGAVGEHVKQIGQIQRELELLHDKFTILYARGAIGQR